MPLLCRFLEGDGLLEDDVVLSSPPESHFNTVFQLCYRTRVNAADELLEFEKKNALRMNALDQDSKDYYNTLKRVRAKEQEMNARSFTESIGNGLNFGDVVQLRHRRSGKWLCAADQQVATVEQENFKVYLAAEASALAWFTLTPAAAFQSFGDAIVDMADVCFTPSETKGASFLHISTLPVVPVGMKRARRERTPVIEQLELNCSLAPSTFKFMRFCEHLANEALIKAGNLVQFVDPQTNGTVRVLTECLKQRMIKSNRENGEEEQLSPSAILQPSADTTVSSNSLWVVEHLDQDRGDTFEVSEYLALRHLNTGEYLSISERPVDELKVSEVSSPTKNATPPPLLVRGRRLEASTLAENSHHTHNEAGTQISASGLLDLHGGFLRDKHLVVLKHKGRNYMHIQRRPNSAGAFEMTHSADSEKALPLVVKRVDAEFAIDAFFGLQACQLLEIMKEQLESKLKDPTVDLTYFNLNDKGGDMELIRYLFRKMLCFLIDDPAAAAIWNVDTNLQHQQLLREQGITDVLLDFLEVTFKLLEREETGMGFRLDPDQKTHVLETTRHAFTLIRISMVNNPTSQLYVSDRFSILLKYAGNNALANECISLLLDNATIQEQKIGSTEIQEFITMLQHRAFNSSVLDMLKHVCSCHGKAMENNQTEVGETLLNSKEARQTLVGLQETEGGKLMLTFPGSRTEENLQGLRDETKVKFFVSQLYLFAEMCYDRNYIAIALLRKVVSFTSLCAAIRDEKLAHDIRSAMVRLATCMYVDCEPQQSQRTKNLSFRWSDLTKQNSAVDAALSMKIKKPVKTEATRNFKTLKTTIHASINEPEFTEFTEHMVGLLLKLVDFKFYHEDPAELQSVIDIILNRLASETERDAKAQKKIKKSASQKLGGMKESLKHDFDAIEVKSSKQNGFIYCITHLNDPQLKKTTLRFIDQPAIMLSIIGLVFVAILLPLGVPDVTIDQCKETGTDVWSSDCISRYTFDGYYYGGDKAHKTECAFAGSGEWVPCELQEVVEKKFGMLIFELVTYFLFLIELSTRIWAMNSTKDFCMNPFCMIDWTCVFLDTIVYALPSLLGPIGKNTKVLRALRLAKLVRLLKVARLMKALRDAMNQVAETPPWQLPHSYRHPDRTKMQGMLEMVNVLLRAQEIDTRGKLISLVKECQNQHALGQEKSVVKVEANKALQAIRSVQKHLDDMQHVMVRVHVMQEVKLLNIMSANGEDLFGYNTEPFLPDLVTLAVSKSAGVKLEANNKCNFSETMLRLVMYENRELVQQAIELLMSSCTANKMLIGHLQDVQLLVNPADEQMYEHLMSELDFISSTLDSYELFSGLATADDVKKSDRIKTALVGLERYCMTFEDSVLSYATGGKGCKPNLEVQTMLRHLDAFGAALTWRDSVSVNEADYDLDDADSMAEYDNSIAIRTLINDFLCAFIFGNEDLQDLAFPHVDIFIEDLEFQQIGSSNVISEVLRDNERLIRLAPVDLIPSVLNLLEKHQDGPRDPNLAEVLYVMVQAGGRDRPIRENQVAIMQLLTRSPNANEMLFVCNKPDSEQYKHRQDLMDEYTNTNRSSKRAQLANSTNDRSGSSALHPLELVPISSPASGTSHGPPSSIPIVSPSSQAAGFSAGEMAIPAMPSFSIQTSQSPGFNTGTISVPPLPSSPMDATAEGRSPPPFSEYSVVTKVSAEEPMHGSAAGVHKPSIVDEYSHLPVDLQYHVIMLRTLAHCGAGGINIVEANIQSVYKVEEMLRDLLEPGMVADVRTALGILWFDIVMDVQVQVPNMSHNKMWWQAMKTFPGEIDKLITAFIAIDQEGDTIANPRLSDHGLAMRQHTSFVFEYIIPCVTTFFNVYFRLEHDDMYETDIALRIYNSIAELYKLPLKKPILNDEKRGTLLQCSQALRSHCQFDPAPRPLLSTVAAERKASLLLSAGSTAGLRESFKKKADALAQTDESVNFANLGTVNLVKMLNGLPKLADNVFDDLRFEPTLQKLVRHTRSLIKVLDDRKVLEPEHEPTTIWIISLFRTMIEDAWGFGVEMRDEDEIDGEDADEAVAVIQAGLNSSGATTLCLDLIARGLSARVKQEAIKLLLALLFREGGALQVQKTIHEHLSLPSSAMLLEEVRASIEFIEFAHNDVERNRKEADKLKLEIVEGDDYVHEIDTLHEIQNQESMLLLRALQLMCEGHFGPNQDIFREQRTHKYSVNIIESLTTAFCSLGRHKSAFAIDSALKIADLILEAIQGPCEQNQMFLASDTELIETMNRMLRMEPEKNIDEEDLDELKVTMLQVFCALLEGQVPDPTKGNQNMIFERMLSAVHLEFLTLLVAPPPPPVNVDDPDDVEAMLAAQEALEDAELKPKQVQALVLLQMLKAYSELHGREFDTKKLDVVGDEVISIEIIWRDTTQKRFFKVPEVCKHLAEATRNALVEEVNRDNMDAKLEDFVDRAESIMCELDHQEYLKELGIHKIFSRSNQNNATWLTFFINVWINTMYLLFQVKGVKLVPDDTSSLQGLEGYSINPAAWPVDEPQANSLMRKWYFNPRHGWFGNSTLEAEDGIGITKNCYRESEDPAMAISGTHNNFLACTTSREDMYFDPGFSVSMFIQCLNVIQCTLAAFTLMLFIIVRAPIAYKMTMRATKSKIQSFISIFTKSLTLYYIGYLAFAILGAMPTAMGGSPMFNAILLYDILVKNATSRDVLLAVYYPVKQLMATVILGLFTVYIFSFVAFLYRAEDFVSKGARICDSMLGCFQMSLGMGLRAGGGLGEYLYGITDGVNQDKDALSARFIMDFAFFAFVIIILMNIIFGIIIDTFSELREAKQERVDDTEGTCFICGIDKNIFDSKGAEVYPKHISKEHNMWAYLKFMILIWKQDKDDDDGLEQYVRMQLEAGSLDWLPAGKALCLDEDHEDEDKVIVSEMKLLEDSIRAGCASIRDMTESKNKELTDTLAMLRRKTKMRKVAKGIVPMGRKLSMRSRMSSVSSPKPGEVTRRLSTDIPPLGS
jgi:hypothetical protein